MGETNRRQMERSVDLRDRIAAAIRSADVMPSTDCDPYVEMADAVIAELKLRRETVGLIYRYITNWQGSDDAAN